MGLTQDALASDRTDVLAKMQQSIDGFNTNDSAAMAANLMPSLVILDDLPPFHFQGPNAPSDWGNAFSAKAEEDEITEPGMKLLDATYVNVRGNHAYAVVPAIYSFKERNEPIQQDCIITAVLEKTNGNWRIASWVWTRQ
jgi:hypothetical protein